MHIQLRSNVAFNIKKCCKVTVESSVTVELVTVRAVESALTVHSHGRSQRVSLRGVNRTLPFFCQMDEMR